METTCWRDPPPALLSLQGPGSLSNHRLVLCFLGDLLIQRMPWWSSWPHAKLPICHIQDIRMVSKTLHSSSMCFYLRHAFSFLKLWRCLPASRALSSLSWALPWIGFNNKARSFQIFLKEFGLYFVGVQPFMLMAGLVICFWRIPLYLCRVYSLWIRDLVKGIFFLDTVQGGLHWNYGVSFLTFYFGDTSYVL